ncbi:MAG: redoxin family protein [Bacteroidetes bacterium]|nr:redoxin family protein [Bacteroidota bacterium]
MKSLLSMITGIAFSISVYAQSISPIKVGDSVPDISLTGFLNDTTTMKLNNFYNNKLLIIDFFATWCEPCISSLSRFDSLSQIFKEKIKILPVTYQSNEIVRDFFSKRSYLKNLRLQFLTGDTVLHKFFPHIIIPHEVWINSFGKVIAITSHEDVTYQNINSALKNMTFNFTKKEDLLDFDMFKTFHVPDSSIEYRSILMHSPNGITNGGCTLPLNFEQQKGHLYNRLFRFGVSIQMLYVCAAYSDNAWFRNTNRFVVKTKDSLKIFDPSFVSPEEFNKKGYRNFSDWSRENGYLYELILPKPVTDTLLYQEMLEDLNRVLPYKGSFKRKRTACWILKNKTEKSKELKSHGGKPTAFYAKDASTLLKFQNKSIDSLVLLINKYSDSYLVINETENKFPVDLDLNLGMYYGQVNMDEVKKKFETYGFELTKELRWIDVLYIEDK